MNTNDDGMEANLTLEKNCDESASHCEDLSLDASRILKDEHANPASTPQTLRHSEGGLLLGADHQVKHVVGDCSCYTVPCADWCSVHIDALLIQSLREPLAACIATVVEGNDWMYRFTGVPFYPEPTSKSKSQTKVSANFKERQPMYVDVTARKFKSDSEIYYLVSFSNCFSEGLLSEMQWPDRGGGSINAEEITKNPACDAGSCLQGSTQVFQSASQNLLEANRELQAANLRIQSVNEKLCAINTDCQEKISELMELTLDLQTLLNSSGNAIVLLDSTLAIRHYTPGMSKYLDLLPGDIERPITDFNFDADYDDLVNDLNVVLQDGTSVIKSVDTLTSGEKLTLIMNPYISSDMSVNGVVFTVQESFSC